MVLNLVLVFILTALPFGRAVAHSATPLAVTPLALTSTLEELSRSPQWLKLGHYKKSLSGFKSALSDNFFLSKNGARDPHFELQLTVDKLFWGTPEERLLQCKYPARSQWLSKALNIPAAQLEPCDELKAWKASLGSNELYIVFASGDLNSAGSSFGHTFLRIHNSANTRQKEILDYGINYAARTGEDTGALFALKGLFGFYPGAYSMLPFHEKMIEYTNLEGRNLWEYKLKFSPEQVDLLIDHLLELDGTSSPYYFLTKNCSQEILELLDVALPNEDLGESFKLATIPLDSLKLLADRNLIEGEQLRVSLNAQWLAHYKNLSATEKTQLLVLTKNPDADLTQLSPASQAKILEAFLNHLAVRENSEKTDLKETKHRLSVKRAQLGRVTAPVIIERPASPLLSTDSKAFYLGYGNKAGQNYLSLKYRYAFHDLLSDDSGMAPFTHLEALGVEGRYNLETQSTKLHELILLKVLNTAPVSVFSRPLSWQMELGTEEELNPKLNWGVGYTHEISLFKESRFGYFLKQANLYSQDRYRAQLGGELMFISKLTQHSSFLVSYEPLYNFKSSTWHQSYSAGGSYYWNKLEVRLTAKSRQQISDNNADYLLQFIF